MNKRTLTLVIAAFLAVGAGLLSFDYMLSVNKNAPTAPPRTVLVAAQDIPARSRFTADMVKVITRPADSVDPNALSSPANVSGMMALVSIPSGATITTSNSGKPLTFSLPVRLRPGMRAMSIPVDIVKSVAGLVEAGDYVDVVAIPPRANDEDPKAYTILRDVEVMAVGSQLEDPTATPPPGESIEPRTVTLEVTPQQADLLAMADLNTVLRLALRSPEEASHSLPAEQLVFAKQTMPASGPAPASQPQQAAGKAADPVRPVRHRSAVTIIDGDQIVDDTAGNRP